MLCSRAQTGNQSANPRRALKWAIPDAFPRSRGQLAHFGRDFAFARLDGQSERNCNPSAAFGSDFASCARKGDLGANARSRAQTGSPSVIPRSRARTGPLSAMSRSRAQSGNL
eukprot:7117499-Pyramimonas_sp.AAC.2